MFGNVLIDTNLEKLINDSIGGNFTGTGNGLNNTITGNTGNDTLDGKAGTDTLIGGAGDDTYIVNLKSIGIGTAMTVALEDTIVETAVANSGIDTIQLSGTFNLTKATTLTLGANLENLDASGATNTKLNLAANTLTGNNEANILNGLGGNDQLLGGAGADTLIGGIGKDTLTGGAGNDIFRFDTALSAATNVDAITDFTLGDKIQLENAVFAKLVTVGALSAANFVSGAGAVALDLKDFIIYDTATGNLSYDADGSGAGAAVQFATLTGIPTLTIADIQVA